MNTIGAAHSRTTTEAVQGEHPLFPDARWHATRAERLRQVRAGGLTLRPDFDDVAARWESWWRFEAAHPLLRVAVAKDRTLRWDNGFDLIDRPGEWVRLRRRQVENTLFFGEEVPAARVNIGPVALAAFLGPPFIWRSRSTPRGRIQSSRNGRTAPALRSIPATSGSGAWPC